MIWLFRFFLHVSRLHSFKRARWVLDYEKTERGFHTASTTVRKGGQAHRPAVSDFKGSKEEGLKNE